MFFLPLQPSQHMHLRFPPWQPWLQERRLGPPDSGLEINQARPGLAVKYDGFWTLEFSLAVLESVFLRYETRDIQHAGGTILKSLMGKIDGLKQMI